MATLIQGSRASSQSGISPQVESIDEGVLTSLQRQIHHSNRSQVSQEILQPVIEKVHFLRGKTWEVTRLASCSNHNFVLTHRNEKYVLRIPGGDSNCFSNRRAEHYNAKQAFNLEFNPAGVLFFDEQNGILVAPFLNNVRFLEKSDFLDAHMIKQAAIFLKKLHQAHLGFKNDFDYFLRIEVTFQMVHNTFPPIPSELMGFIERLLQIKGRLRPQHFESIPCHNDAIFQNFALTSSGLKMIDWEASGNGDPVWDLSVLAAICHFTEEQKEILLGEYRVLDNRLARYKMTFFITLIHVQSCIWSFSKIALRDFCLPEETLISIHHGQLQLCKELMASQTFTECVDFLTA